ncbi:MAG TPA: CARDB domain-containing protein, partial [Pseudobacteroides sp.]|uniref:CARDB domain-containing protein n=1 Tax=Pseudobacteroides sp. TaxID=1968840 RepID=UPI002F950531
TSALYEKVTVTIKEYEKPLAPTELNSLWNTGTAVSLKWTRPTAGMAPESYEVYSNDKVIAATKQTTIVCAGLTPNQLNKVYVKSVSAEGGKSDSSNVLEIQAPEDDHGNTKENATPIELEKEISGVFHDSDDYDYFTFVPKKTGIYVIKIYNSYYTPEFYSNEGYPCGSGTNNDYHFEAGKVYYLRTGTDNRKDYRFIVRLKTSKPDLVFDYIIRNKYLAGQPVDLRHIVTNIGDTMSKGSFKVGVTVSGENNNYIGECTTDIDKDRNCSIGPMLDAAGNQWTPNAPGEYLLTFNIDSENKIDEANEENNKITVKFYVDDYADSPSGAKEIRIGQDVKGYLSTYTDTDYFLFIPKKTSKYRFTIFKNNIDFFCDSRNVPTFANNTQIFIQSTFIQGSSYYIYVCDYDKKINTNEEYTIISKEIAPDLTISKVDLTDNKNGEPCKLRAEISNVGDEVLESGRFRVGFTAENQKKTFYTDYYEGSVTFKSMDLFLGNTELNEMLKSNGFHKIKAFIEKSSPFNESNETNNSVDATVGYYSDLTITDIIFPYETNCVDPIVTKIVIKNVGQKATQPLYPVIAGMHIDGIDTKYYTNYYTKIIQPNQSVTLAVYDDNGDSPQINIKGTYEVQASLEEYYQDNDMYKENNSFNKILNVDTLPDLAVTEIILDPPNPVVGEKVTLKAKVRNISENPVSISNDCKVGFKIDDSDILYWANMPSKLKPGEKAIVTGYIDDSNRTWDAEEGEHKITAIVDALDNIREMDENNNVLSRNIIVKEKCKFKIEDIVLDPPNPVKGEKVILKARIRNISNENSPYGRTYKIGFKISDGTEIRTESLRGAICGGEYIVLSTDGINQSFWIPKNEGDYKISAELDESADTFEKTIKVTRNRVFEAEADYDNDGLSNEKENEIGTDYNNYDTDGDSISDGDEVNGTNGYKTDPLNPDSDEDGAYDNIEIKLGKSPVNKDEYAPFIAKEYSQSESVVVEVYGNSTLEALNIEVNELSEMTNGLSNGIIANPVEITLDGGSFKEATISFYYDEMNLNGIPEEDLTVYWLDYTNKTLVPLPDYNVNIDAYNNIITAKVNHFSTYIPGKKNLNQINYYNNAVFVIDESGSMWPNNVEQSSTGIVNKIATNIVEKVNEFGNEFGVVKFSGTARKAIDLSGDKKDIIDAIKSTGGDGSTDILRGLKAGEAIILNSKYDKYLLLLSDGEDNNYTEIVGFAKNMASKKIKVLCVSIGKSQLLNEIANITGGICYSVDTSGNIDLQISNIVNQIIEQLKLSVSFPPEKKPQGKKLPPNTPPNQPIKLPIQTYGCISYAGEIDAYEFTPDETKIYCISSTGETDTEINIFDTKGMLISSSDSNDDNEWDKNFYILMNLTKGEKYRFEVNHSDILNGTGEYYICISDPIKEKLGPDQAYLKLLAYEMEGTYAENPDNNTVDVTIDGEKRTFNLSKIFFVNGQVAIDIKDFTDAFGIFEMYAAPNPEDTTPKISIEDLQMTLSGLGCEKLVTLYLEGSKLNGKVTTRAIKNFQKKFMGRHEKTSPVDVSGIFADGTLDDETNKELLEYNRIRKMNPAFLKNSGVSARAYLENVYKLTSENGYTLSFDGKNIVIIGGNNAVNRVSKIFIPELDYKGVEKKCYAKIRNIKIAYANY